MLLLLSCNKGFNNISEQPKRAFATSFESVSDFDGFYITPQSHLGTTFHELTDSNVYSGTYSHRAWIKGANSASTINNNHRGYPTVQFQKTPKGPFKTPCYVSLWVWLDMELNANAVGEDDWFSFATFTDDETDNWNRTVLVNLSADGFVHLQHTTNQGEQNSIFQTSDITFPQREWVSRINYPKRILDSTVHHNYQREKCLMMIYPLKKLIRNKLLPIQQDYKRCVAPSVWFRLNYLLVQVSVYALFH